MKKFVCLLMSLLLAFSMMGVCAVAEEKVELTMWIWDQNQLPGTQAMADAFHEANPNITINVSCIADYTTKLPTVLGTEDCPDIMWLWGTATVDFLESGMLVNLQDYIDRDNYDTTPWSAGITEWYTRNGDLYAIPKDIDGFSVFANKSLFEAAGVDLPEYDWTWEDFEAVAEALTTDGVYGFAGADNHRVFSMTSLCYGGQYYSEDGLTCLISNENTAKAWSMWKNMMDKGSSASYTDMIELGGEAMFTSGIAAMHIGGSWMVKSFYEALGDDLVCLSIPTGSAGKILATHGIGYAMSSTCANKDEAWKFLAYLGTKEAQTLLADVVIPAHLEAASSWSENFSVDVSAVVKPIGDAVMYPMASKNCTEANSLESKYINSFMAGEFATAEDCLAAAQEEIQAAINK